MNTETNSSQSYDRDELGELIDALCDDRIDDQQAARLNTILASSEEAMEFYVNSMWINTSVERHFASVNSTIDQTFVSTDNVSNQAKTDTAEVEPTETESKLGVEPVSTSTATRQALGNSHVNRTGSTNTSISPARSMDWSKLLAVAAAIALLVGLAVAVLSGGGGNQIGDGKQVVQNPVEQGGNAKSGISPPVEVLSAESDAVDGDELDSQQLKSQDNRDRTAQTDQAR